MIVGVHGNIFAYPAKTIVNPVSCDGSLDSSVCQALEVIDRKTFDYFRLFCHKGLVKPGVPFISRAGSFRIFNIPIKNNVEDPIMWDHLENGLKILAEDLRESCHSAIVPAFTSMNDRPFSEKYHKLVAQQLKLPHSNIFLINQESSLLAVDHAEKWHIKDSFPNSFLMEAISQRSLEAVKVSTEEGADVNFVDALYNSSPLHYAVQRDCYDICEFLIAHGADVNAADILGSTPLHFSLQLQFDNEGDFSICKLLLENGADPNCSDEEGYLPLMQAVRIYQFCEGDPITMLLEQGADINKVLPDGTSSLHFAAHEVTGVECLKLLRFKPDVNILDDQDRSPLHYAATYDVAVALIDAGARLDISDIDGNTPLHLAAVNCCYDVCDLLIDRGADLEAPNNKWQTPLAFAYEDQSFRNCALLLDKGAKDVVQCSEQVAEYFKDLSDIPF